MDTNGVGVVVGVCPHCKTEVDVIGTKEAAGVLGVSPSQYQNLKNREGFPAPWSSGLGQGALWLRSDLLDWKDGRRSVSMDALLQQLDKALTTTEWRSVVRKIETVAKKAA
jgi:predicted DNA-binding transcriptional regulator AlpA